MSEPRNPLPVPQPPPRPRRLRRFLLRHVPLALAGLVVLVMLATVGMYLWMSSAQFQNLVRRRLIAQLEQFTGGQVEVASFHWSLLQLEAEAGGLVIHGSEAAGEAPYARVDRLRCASVCSISGVRPFSSTTLKSTIPRCTSSSMTAARPTSPIRASRGPRKPTPWTPFST